MRTGLQAILCACTVEYIKNSISASIVVWFLAYLAEKQTVKMNKSTEVQLEQTKCFLVFFLHVAYVIGHRFLAEWNLGERKE